MQRQLKKLKLKFKIRALLSLVLLATLSACSLVDEYRRPSNRLIGSWRYSNAKTGPLVLTFRKDFTFEVDGNGDGIKDIWGAYELFGDRVSFQDDLARINTDCYEKGFHQAVFLQDTLLFTLIADQCKPRKAVLSQPMTKYSPETIPRK